MFRWAVPLVALALATLAPASAWAQAKTLRILVGFPAGQATDLVARILAERLKPILGYPVLVENRPGQGGSIALAAIAKAEPDGTVMSLSALAAYVVNPHMYEKVSYDPLTDFEPVSRVADLPLVLIAHPSVPVQDVPSLVAYAKANPNKLTHSSSGAGTLSHLAMEHLKRAAGIDIQHVPYQGSPRAMTDLIGGRIDIGMDTIAVTIPHVKAGSARLLAVGTEKRLPEFPETPTIAESGYPGFHASAWLGLVYPRGTPAEIVTKTADAVRTVVEDPEVRAKLASIGAIPRPSTPAEFAQHLASEYARWGEVVRQVGLDRR